MKTTSNLGLKKIELTDSPPDITVQDDNWDKIDKHLNTAIKYQKAGGTGTAITLTEVTLQDGYQKTFLVTANNNGVATKINSKNLYKPGTTTSPNLIAGKAVTVWYDATGDSFFIKASAEGNVTVADVLAGKSFSNDNDTGLVGTMVDRRSKGFSVHRDGIYQAQGGWLTFKLGVNGAIDENTFVALGINNFAASVIQHGVKVGNADANGAYIEGTYTSDGTVENGDMLEGKVGHSKGVRKVGTIKDMRGKQLGSTQSNESYYNPDGTLEITGTTRLHVGGVQRSFEYATTGGTGLTTKGLRYAMVGSGFYDTTSTIDIPINNLQPHNIKKGVQIGGSNSSIVGTYEGEATSVTGTVKSGGDVKSAIIRLDPKNSTGSNKDVPFITVTGLTFKPSMIVIYDVNVSNGVKTVCATYHDMMNTGITINCINLSSVDNIGAFTGWTSLSTLFNVTATGFVLPCREMYKEYTWVAYK